MYSGAHAFAGAVAELIGAGAAISGIVGGAVFGSLGAPTLWVGCLVLTVAAGLIQLRT